MSPVPGPEVLEDYEALRRGPGAYRLARDVLWMGGPDAVEYLEGQCSQEVGGLGVDNHAEALLLEPDGKLDALVRVSRVGPEEFVIDVDAGAGELVEARLNRFRLRSRVAIEPLGWACVALRGSAVETLDLGPFETAPGAAGPGDGETRAVRPQAAGVDWNGWFGVDLLGPDPGPVVPDGVRWCGDAAWEACRIEAGVPRMGRELDGRTIAEEAGLVGRAVSFTKGCYTGQELVARLDARGNRVARRLHGVVLTGRGEVEAGSLVGAELRVPGADKAVGTVTSAAWCPGVGGPAGLAYVHRSVTVPGPVTVHPAGGGPGLAGEVRILPLA